MKYKSPFYPVTKAFYAVTKNSPIGLDWFDSAVPITEIEDYFRKQKEFAYGILGASDADCTATAHDMASWNMSLQLEIYSNYKGRKVIAEKLEALLNYLSGDAGWDALQKELYADGYQLISIKVGSLRTNLPVYGDTGVWQNGGTTLIFRIDQIA